MEGLARSSSRGCQGCVFGAMTGTTGVCCTWDSLPIFPGWIGIDTNPVLMELRDGQSKRIDRLELRECPGQFAYLLGV